MAQPFTADGKTIVASYEHVSRTIEINNVPYAGWNEMSGGGTSREGMDYIRGAGAEPRGLTEGKVTPQDITLKLEVATWEAIKAQLKVVALASGRIDDTAYQVVPFQIVDQWRATNPLAASKTTTYTVFVNAEKPTTANDGTQFYWELTLKQTGVAKESYL